MGARADGDIPVGSASRRVRNAERLPRTDDPRGDSRGDDSRDGSRVEPRRTSRAVSEADPRSDLRGDSRIASRLTPERWRRALGTVTSVVLLIASWTLVAVWLDDNALPTPLAVWHSLVTEWRSGELVFHLAVTLARVAAAFFVAMVIGAAIGIRLGTSEAINRVADPWLILLLNIPALVIIVLAYIWFGLNEAAAIGAVALNKIPNVVVTMREGARALDPALAEMARVYRFGRVKRLRHVVLPQLQPFFAAATRSGLSLIWKIVLVVELLGRSNGVGFQIHLYFQLFDVATILAYTLAFVAIMLLVEYAVLQPLERHGNRWRPARP